ncbi:MAG: transposase [Planctomycetota bacterium]
MEHQRQPTHNADGDACANACNGAQRHPRSETSACRRNQHAEPNRWDGSIRASARDRRPPPTSRAATIRPAIVHERLSLTPSGKVLYGFKRPWRDGSTHVVLDPLTLLERLAALIPAPRRKLVTHHGVFAPAFPLRHTVVPPPPKPDTDAPVEHPDPHHACAHSASAPASASVPLSTPAAAQAPPNKARTKPRPRYLWADLLRRIYLVDILTCPTYKGRRRRLAFLTERESIVRILRHLGLKTEPPVVAPARPPPALALPFP